MGSLVLQSIRKSFGAVDVLKGIDLDVAHGDFIVFVGPSGCGKTTLLRIIAGLEEQSSGHVTIDGKVVDLTMPARSGIAMVFQSYALYGRPSPCTIPRCAGMCRLAVHTRAPSIAAALLDIFVLREPTA
jgi:ABC-type sugar transport system ATPase subunit